MNAKRYFCLLTVLLVFLTACSAPLAAIDGYEASFRGHMVELYGEYAPLSDIYSGDNYLKLFDDGTGIIAFSGEEDEISWTQTDGDYSITVQGEACSAAFSDGLLTMELDGAIITYVADGADAPEIPTTSPAVYDTDLSTPYGTYHGLTITQFDEPMDMDEFYGGECYLYLGESGMGTLVLGGSELTVAWEVEGTQFVISDMNGINSVGYLDNGIVVLDYMETGLQLAFAKEGAEG